MKNFIFKISFIKTRMSDGLIKSLNKKFKLEYLKKLYKNGFKKIS